MPKTGKIYIVEFDADGNPYFRKLKQMEDATERSSKKIGSMWEKLGKTAITYFTADALLSAAKYTINAFQEQERAIKRLDVAYGKSSKGLVDYATQMQKVSTFTDENVITSMALIANYVKEEKQIKALTKAAMNLSIAKGIDLSSAAELVAKTVGSSTNALKRQGIEFDNNLRGTERVNAVLQSLNMFQGQVEGQVETTSGKFENLTNQIEDNAEAIGEKLIPVVNTFLEKLNKLLTLVGSSNFDKLLKFMPQIGFAFQSDQMSKEEFQNKWNKTLKYGFNFGSGDPQYFLGPEIANLKNDRTSLESLLGTGSGNVQAGDKNKVVKNKITEWKSAQMNARGRGGSAYGGIRDYGFGEGGVGGPADQMFSAYSAGMTKMIGPLKDEMENISTSFVDRFGEINNIASQFGNILGISADTFVGKLISGVDTVSQILSLITSIVSFASGGGPITSLFGLAEGGTVVNKHGKLSYVPIPKFARGGSFTVPPGYSNDSGLIRVQSGERVDVTPSSKVPMLGQSLDKIFKAITAGNVNNSRRNNQPIQVNVQLDGETVASSVFGYENNFNKRGIDKTQLRAGKGL